MWMRASQHFVVVQPVFGDGAEISEGLHRVARVEDVVYHAFKVVRVVGVWHNVLVEHGLQLEIVRVELFVGAAGVAEHFLEIGFVLELFEVGVIGADFGVLQKLEDAGVGQGVEVPAEEELNGGGIVFLAGPEVGGGLLLDLLQLVHEHHRLDEFDVAKLGIPVNVGCRHQQGLRRLKRT